MEGGRLIEGAGGCLLSFPFNELYFILVKSLIEKQKLTLSRKCDVSINVFRLLKQWLVIKHTVVPLYTLHTNKVAIETGVPCIPTT